MRRRFPFRRGVMIISVVVLGSFFVVRLAQRNYGCDWTGFGVCEFPKGRADGYRPEKTLWDWLELLSMPTALALGAIAVTWAGRQHASRIAEQRAQDGRLQTYLKEMTELLLEKNLRKPNAGDEVRQVAHVQTLIALRRLDRERRTILMQFLRASQLVGTEEAQMIVDFRRVDLTRADLRGIPLSFMNLAQSNLEGADLEGADLEGANLTSANLQRTRLSSANLAGVDLFGANLRGANLTSADLTSAGLEGANLTSANLRGANLTSASAGLEGADLFGADLRGANLTSADLFEADLEGANLEGANLEGADLEGADLRRADLTSANLQRTRLSSANLKDARVTPEQLAQAASLKGATMPDGSIHD